MTGRRFAEAVPPPEVRRVPLWKRRTAALSRWLHVYLSMFSFAALLFFAVTGLTLNHAEWFGGQQRTNVYKGAVDVKWVKTADANAVAKLEIVEHLRQTHHIAGALSEFRVEDAQCEATFKGPGYEAGAVIDRETGAYELTETRMGLFAVLNDLHKGRDTGKAWSAAIDIAAILMTCVSLTGLILIFFLMKRRVTGLVTLGVGALLAILAYWIWVP
jgi:uncharacterized protein